MGQHYVYSNNCVLLSTVQDRHFDVGNVNKGAAALVYFIHVPLVSIENRPTTPCGDSLDTSEAGSWAMCLGAGTGQGLHTCD